MKSKTLCWNCNNFKFKKVKEIYKCTKCKAEKPKNWSEIEIRDIILKGDKSVLCKAIISISNNQTTNELINGRSEERNDIGFNASDARFFTAKLSYGYSRLDQFKRFLKSNFKHEQDPFRTIIGTYVGYIRSRMLNYSKQLCKIANQKELIRVQKKFDANQLRLFER